MIRHAPAAWRVAVAVVGETLARGLLEDAFLAAWRHLPRLRDPARFGPWLYRIVLSGGRSMLRRGRSVREIPVTAWHDGTLVTPHDGMGATEARAVLASTFSALSYEQRALIALHYAAGLTLLEIADALDIPVGTAGSRLTAALEALRRQSGVDRADGGSSPWTRPGSTRAAPTDDGAPAPGNGAGATGERAGATGEREVATGEAAVATGERMPPQEPHVEAFLESMTDLAVPGDLAGAIASHVREHPSRRPSLRLPLLAAAAGLLLTVAIAMTAGWDPPFDLLPVPQETASLPPVALPEPTASAMPGVNPDPSAGLGSPEPAEAWEWGVIVGTGAEIVADPAVPEPIGVTPDDTGYAPVLVLERRVVDGRTWVRIEQGGYGWDARFVWIPETIPSVGPSGYDVPVLERTRFLRCATGEPPTIESLASVTAPQRLACYGSGSFTIGPVQAIRAWDRDKSQGTPAWLAGPMTTMLEGPPRPDGPAMSVPVHVNPALGITLPQSAWVRVTLHLDDPVAATCTRETTARERPVGEASDQVLWCRQQLVVTGYTEVPAPAPEAPTPVPYPVLAATRTSLPDAPMDARVEESAAWTGTELVIWGGAHRPQVAASGDLPADGAAFDVATGTWRAVAVSPLGGRGSAPNAWTGSEVLIWGGTSTGDAAWLDDGAAWSPATNTWRRLPDSPLKGGFPQVAAWSGERWYVASGKGLAAYDPATDTWSSEADLPIGADDIVRMAWAGDRLVLLAQMLDGSELWTMRPGEVWVNRASPPLLDVPADGVVFDGARLWVVGVSGPEASAASPVIAWWSPPSGQWQEVIDSPVDTVGAAAVWNGTQLVVVGARGAAWEPESGTWFMLPEGDDDRQREEPTVVWAGDRLIVWGGWGERARTAPDGWQMLRPPGG